MASLAEQSFSMFPQQQQDEYTHFESTHVPVYSSAPMDLSIAADAYGSYVQRAPSQELYTSPSTISYEPSLYTADTSNYIINGPTSPGIYGDDYLPSSGLSTASAPSAPSSAVGSPLSNHGQIGIADWTVQGLGIQPGIANSDFVEFSAFGAHGLDDMSAAFEFASLTHPKTFVDPSLIHPEISRPPMAIPSYETHYQPAAPQYPTSPSALSSSSPQPHMIRTNSSSPYLQNGSFQPATAYSTSPYATSTTMTPGAGVGARRLSMSKASNGSNNFISPVSADYPSGDEVKEKHMCTYPECGKTFKDLKAHMLTHQTERPEKCPIMTCEYHVKGFARKYDKNRHTLTHYKGTMVCGFCPGSGSAAEKSFNRADVFKRHLTAVHGVEQTPPNSRRRASGAVAPKTLAGYAPDATGKCSTCSQTFTNAQDFYEHLDDCVLRIVQQEDPAEAINAKRLAEVAEDKNVHQTLEKNNLPVTTQTSMTEDDEDDEDMADDDETDDVAKSTSSPLKKNSQNRVSKSRGITHSRGGVPLSTKSRGRNKRRDYPSSWGFNKGQMTMKKRVLAVFDGPRRLAKDDMMLSTDHEVRIKLSDGKSYVTDLDVQTLKRAEGFHNASDDEKGPWISDDPTEEQLKEMQRMLDTTASDL
ncbi:uncharacterized protein TRIVIDRAFT_175568 [Trichoderma virens Gv29-8]|uniref:C2H2-type domain-containing protein n=1 Tax=Hypocrea virens (strain Gv29-8 / FGSC 10586) TaxID=413071 RepID=G9NDT4_HYPVG|nr:uncharacterized protein TRIVIDRAFT_175568 [Trichoderma virens Gv29-8]EHK15184.1 hypothetical protein TRIVIDRAFT_175568 [Trichoderma virens Gv29-8]